MMFERSAGMEDSFNVLSRVDEKTVMPSELLYIGACMRRNLRATSVQDIGSLYNTSQVYRAVGKRLQMK